MSTGRSKAHPLAIAAPGCDDPSPPAGVQRSVHLSAASVTVGLHDNPVERVVEESGLA